jgi:hypothetical protein
MASTTGPMPDAPMSPIELRLERVNRAVALDRAVSEMAHRHVITAMTAMEAASRDGVIPPRLIRARDRQHKAFLRLLYALMRLAQSTDADLQRSVTRS